MPTNVKTGQVAVEIISEKDIETTLGQIAVEVIATNKIPVKVGQVSYEFVYLPRVLAKCSQLVFELIYQPNILVFSGLRYRQGNVSNVKLSLTSGVGGRLLNGNMTEIYQEQGWHVYAVDGARWRVGETVVTNRSSIGFISMGFFSY